jgi:gliding motility-associated-like protein
MIKRIQTIVILLLTIQCMWAQGSFSPKSSEEITLITKDNIGTYIEVSNIDVNRIRQDLQNAPVATDIKSGISTVELNLSIDQTPVKFEVVENNTMSKEFKKAAPEVRSYTMQSASMRGRITTSPGGIRAHLFTKDGIVSIYPSAPGSGNKAHIIEYGNVIHEDKGHTHLECGQHGDAKKFPELEKEALKSIEADISNGTMMRTYRLAIVCTGEFYQANGNNAPEVNATITATVNAMNEVYGRDGAINFNLLAPFLYQNPLSDPFFPDQTGALSRPDMAGTQVPRSFDPASFDIGHVFHTHRSGDNWSTGGVAYLASVCNDNTFQAPNNGGEVLLKAGGWSGSFNNNGAGWVSLASHEFGHMFNCPHTFNGSGGSCDDAISRSTAYEIGSGTTIMSYNGICSSGQNIGGTEEENLYFHSNSLIRIINYVENGGNCAAMEPTGNMPPNIDADPCGHNGTFTIPKNTPFILNGEAIDADGDQMTFIWEQYNEDGSSASPTQGFIGAQAGSSNLAPLFRSYPPSATGLTRYFPNKESVNNEESDDFDVLPRVPRTLNFQLVARDNNPDGGGVALQEIEVPVSNGGPLRVDQPNNSSIFTAGEMTTITWSTGNSDDLCNNVDILLSTNGGDSFDYILAEGVNYGVGSRTVTVPPNVPNTSEAKVMIKCVDSECIQFYNVNRGLVDVISNCRAQPLRVCTTDPVSFDQGDAGLELNLNSYVGNPTTDISRLLLVSDPQWRPAAISDGGACSLGNNRYYQIVRVTVERSDRYRLVIGNWDLVAGMSMYQADIFDPNNPCGSAIGSSYRPGSITSVLDVNLEACTEYFLVIDAQNPGTNVFIENFIGPEPFIEIQELDDDYDKTFIAVNQFGRVAFETPTADFRMSPSGEHSVYAVAYKSQGAEPPSNVDPTTWVGQELSQVFNSGDCFSLSAEPKPVNIISSCNITDIVAGPQTACNPADNTFSQEVTVSYILPPMTGNLVVNGQSFPLGTSPQTVTLTGLISDGNPLNIQAEFDENPGCFMLAAGIVTAPENCCPLSVDLPESINACGDEMVILNAGDDGDTYQWALDGVALLETGESIEALEEGTYRVTVTTASGCAKPDQSVVRFFDNPTIEVSAIDTTGCDGEQLIIDLTRNEGDISWFRDGVEVNGQVSDELRVTETGTYTGRATTDQGCFSEDSIDIQFAPSPDVELGIDRMLCEGTPLTLNAGNDGMEYVWFRNGSLLVGENGNTLDVDQSGMYSVSVLGEADCTTEDMVDVEFFALPVADIGGDTAICAGDPVVIFPNPANISDFTFFKDGFEVALANLDRIDITEGGFYELIITNEIGCEVIQSITVVENDLPVVELGDEKIGCEGSNVLLESPIMGGAYSWTFNGMEISTEASVTVSEAGTYQLLVADEFGCEGMDDVLVSFVPGPTLSISGAENFCEGGMTTLTATTTGDNIQWSRDGVDINGATDFNLDVTTSGVYRASVSGNSGCVVEDQVSIEVFENPSVDAGDNLVICDGDSEDRTIQAMGEGLNYAWTRNGSPFSGDENITVTEEGTYQVIVTNTNNCTDQDEFEVRVSALPTVTSSVSTLDICEGIAQDVSITTNASRIEWYRNGSLLAGESGTTLGVSQEGSYEAIVYNDDDCSSMVSITATSRPSPTVDLGMDMILCPNESITLDAGSQTQYDWSTGSSSQTIMVDNPNLDIETSNTYSVQVTNEFNCTAEDEVSITFRPIISGTITEPGGVCEGESVDITAGGGLDYAWNDPNGTLSNTDQATVTASPLETTTYSVVISDDCPNNTDEVSTTVEVFPPAMASAGEDTIVILGREITLNGSGGVSYVWTDPNGAIVSTSANANVSPEELTVYTLVVTDANGCTGRSTVSVDVNDDPLASLEAVNVITPNGDGDNDFLEFIGLEAEPDNTLMIYNRWGNLVFEATGYQTTGGLWDGTKNGEELPADTYYYVLKFGDQVFKSAITILRD